MTDLPTGWAVATLDDLGEYLNGMAFKPEDWTGAGFPIIRIQNLTNPGRPLNRTERAFDERYRVRAGDLLISWSATLDAFIWDGEDAILNQHIFKVTPSLAADPRFLFYASRKAIADLVTSDHLHGSTMKHINRGPFLAHELGLPPLAEQRRMVAKLDALTDRTARARADLGRIPDLAARYKQAVLAKAFRGELSGYGRSGRAIEGWRYAKASAVCGKVQSGGTPKGGFSATGGVPFLKVYNIVGQRVDFDHRPQYVSEDVHVGALRKSVAMPGDVLMNIVGPPLGKVAIIPSHFPEWNINQALTLFRPTDEITSKWLFYFLCGGDSVQSVINETRGSAGQVNISLSQCRDFVLPVPPLDQQAEIVLRIEIAFAEIDRLTTEAAAACRLLDRLDDAVLAKAFRGELVAQDPADEPASSLLERIRAERAAAPKSDRRLSPRTPSTLKKADMPKSRLDDDVKHQPFLAAILKASDTALSADALFKSADLPIADFYKQLAWEIDNGLVKERGETLEAA